MAGICLILSGKSLSENGDILKEYQGEYDLVEIRADFLDPSAWDYLNRWGENLPCPSILTLRLPEDGGVFQGGAPARRAFFEKAVQGPWTYLDIEAAHPLPAHEKIFIESGRKIIRSFHDFQEVPADYPAKMAACSGRGYIAKGAVTPKTTADFNRYLRQTLELDDFPKITLAMGSIGAPSRILAEKLGSLWTYSVPGDQALAPGQFDAITLNHIYGFRKVSKSTKVLGIVGNPILQTKSPRIHNPALADQNTNTVYIPFHSDNLTDFMETADLLKIQGLSVTIPFKEDAAALLGTNASPRVRAIGACNTLYRTAEGVWAGENTDAPGFLSPLLRALGNRSLKDLPVTVLGTGGASRAAVYSLAQAEAKILVLGRNPDRVHELMREFDVAGGNLSEESLPSLRAHSQVIVQTTPLGMGELEGQNPLEWYRWKGHEVAYDLIYNPEKTAFLTSAEKAGCLILNGLPMLWEQAYRQYELFTSQPYPESLKLKY